MPKRGDDHDVELPSLAAFVGQLVDQEAVGDPALGSLAVERLDLDLPIEIDVTSLAGTVAWLGAAPPTQWVETTVMPVFHRLRMRVAATET